jgi:hypothetical protein
MVNRFVAACAVLMLCACGKGGTSGTPPDGGSACATLADCAGGQVCLNAQCVPICHATADCSAGQVCEEGICLAPACGSDSQCASGQACLNSKCTTGPSAAQVSHCDLTPNPAEVRVGAANPSVQLKALAQDSSGHGVHWSQYTWSIGAGPGTVDQTGLVTGTAPGDITVNAAVTGGTATCTATVHAYGAQTAGALRVTVINIDSKEPVAGAKVMVGATIIATGADGVASFANETGTQDVHVFASGYGYTSFIQTNAKDILAPLTPYIAATRRSGFSSHMCDQRTGPNDTTCPPEGDFSALAAQGEAVHMAFFGSSIPNSLLDLSVDTLLGTSHSVTISLGGNNITKDLPYGLVLGVGSNLFGTQDYRVFTDPGKRAIWGLGGNINLTSVVTALGPVLSGGSGGNLDVGALLPQILPLLSKLQAGALVDVQASPPATGGPGTFAPVAVPLNTPLRLRVQAKSPPLPTLDGKYVDGALIVAGAMDYPVGFLPLGLTAGLSAKDASKANTAVVLDPTCDTSGGQAACATSLLPFRMAPPNNGAEGSKYGVAMLALNFGGLSPGSTTRVAVSGLIQTLDKIDYVAPPGAAVNVAFPDSYLNLPATAAITIAKTGRQLNVGAPADARAQIFRFELENNARLAWNIWISPAAAANGAITLPDPSVAAIGLTDPFADAVGSDNKSAGPTARLLSLKLTTAVTAEQLETFGGPVGLDQIGTNLAAFTALQVPVSP